MREKEELMLRLQDFEQKTKKAEKGGCVLGTFAVGQRPRGEGQVAGQYAHSQDGLR